MMKELFQPSVGFPTSQQTAVAYAEQMTCGIKLWAKIDAIGVPLALLLWGSGIVPTDFLLIALFFAISCPIIMILGYSIGWSRYLSWRECYEIVKTKLSD